MGCCMGRKKILPTPVKQKNSSRPRLGARKGNETATVREVRVNTIVEQEYNIFTSIGKGEFGHVVRVQHKKTKIPYAMKIIDLSKGINGKTKPQLELNILSKVNHKYVIRLHNVIQTPRKLYLVMDLATGGELMDRICRIGKFDEYDATKVLKMILQGLQYLHSLGITHRDLKPQNILYYHPGNDSKIIITDFGLSAMRDSAVSPANYLMKTDCGTIEYMAPEVITRARYTNNVDMWSMGVIVYILLSGRLPFPMNGNVLSTLRMICFCKYSFDGEPWDDISEEAKDFIRSLLVIVPEERLNAREALKHQWMRNKQHNKLNLQRSISSNWGDSCVSLKNEKGLKARAKARETSSNSSNSTVKEKPMYGAIDLSHGDKHKLSQGKTRASEGHKGTHNDRSSTYLEKQKDFDDTSAGKPGNDVKNESQEINKNMPDKSVCAKEQHPVEKAEALPTSSCIEAELDLLKKRSEKLARENTTSVQRKESKYRFKVSPVSEATCNQSPLEKNVLSQDCNGNLPGNFVKRSARVDNVTSTQCNFAGIDESHVTERTPLGIARSNRLPPIKSFVSPLNTGVR